MAHAATLVALLVALAVVHRVLRDDCRAADEARSVLRQLSDFVLRGGELRHLRGYVGLYALALIAGLWTLLLMELYQNALLAALLAPPKRTTIDSVEALATTVGAGQHRVPMKDSVVLYDMIRNYSSTTFAPLARALDKTPIVRITSDKTSEQVRPLQF